MQCACWLDRTVGVLYLNHAGRIGKLCPFPFIVLAQHHTSCYPLGMQLNFPDSQRLTPVLERERYALRSAYDIRRAPLVIERARLQYARAPPIMHAHRFA